MGARWGVSVCVFGYILSCRTTVYFGESMILLLITFRFYRPNKLVQGAQITPAERALCPAK
jgi:hypothetical protein